MAERSKADVRQTLAGREAARAVRTERLGEATAPIYVGGLAPGGTIFGAKVTGLYNQAGAAYTDFVTDGYVAALKCVTWNVRTNTFGESDLWIACRKDGHFGLLSRAEDFKYGVEVDDCICYMRAALPIAVPGVDPETYFDGIFEPMEGSWLSATPRSGEAVPSNVGETDGSFWGQLTGQTLDPAVYTFHRLGSISVSGEARELGGNHNVATDESGGHGVIVRISPSPDSRSTSAPTWTFTYTDGGFWASITSETSAGAYLVAAVDSGLTGLAANEVNGVSGIAAGKLVRVFAHYGPHDDSVSPDDPPTYRFEYTKDPNTPSDTVAGETAWGIAPAAGSATTYSRGDHTHGSPGEPDIPVPSDVVQDETSWDFPKNAGVAVNYARGDHTHGMPPYPTIPVSSDSVSDETTWGIVPSGGSAFTWSRGDHTHGSPADPGGGTPGNSASDNIPGQLSSGGSNTDYSRSDHAHGTQCLPVLSDSVSDETTWGITPAAGASQEFARADHTHGSPAEPGGSTPCGTVSDETTWGITPAAGSATEYSRGDHTHGSPCWPCDYTCNICICYVSSICFTNCTYCTRTTTIEVSNGLVIGWGDEAN